jgi:site-specific DNA-methyltransferase (adenine-specific)
MQVEKMNINTVYHGDCLELMKEIDDQSIDMILCDLPYGITRCIWDNEIDLIELWKQYERIMKCDTPILLFCGQPFTSKLICSNLKMFKFEFIYKKAPFNFLNTSHQPLRNHDNIAVFYENKPTYNRQHFESIEWKSHGDVALTDSVGEFKLNPKERKGSAFPRTIIEHVKKDDTRLIKHPTQKPVALFEYLIKTYTNEGDLVLDNCAGSGTTAVACINTKRNYILMEIDKEYVEICKRRIEDTINPPPDYFELFKKMMESI